MSCASEVKDELQKLMVGLAYSGSWDLREERTVVFVHTCWGNTFAVNGAINSCDVEVVDDSTLRCRVYYSGSYTRANYVEPCRHDFDENLSPSGEQVFTVQIRVLQAPIIAWAEVCNLSPLADAGHDSNRFSLEALRNAILQRLHR